MNDWLLILGLIACAILLLIPIVMIGRLVHAIISAWLEHRRNESRRVNAVVPGLGMFSSTDERFWSGEFNGMQVSIETDIGRPPENSAHRVLKIFEELRPLTDAAEEFLRKHEDLSWLEQGSDAFHVEGLRLKANDDSFVLDFGHPSDPDGMYQVEFRDGIPVSSGRDD